MKGLSRFFIIILIIAISTVIGVTGCGGGGGSHGGGTLIVEPVEDDDGEQDIPSSGDGTVSPIFLGQLGVPISKSILGIIDPDPTGLNPSNDFDGDGLSNSEEITSNPYTADYPMIVTRVSAPITMEIRVSETDSTKNYTETLSEEDIKNTREQSMDENHYNQTNEKTTPVVVKTSSSENDIETEEYSLACTLKNKSRYSTEEYGNKIVTTKGSAIDISKSASHDFSSSSSSEDTDFRNVNYIDNLDRSGSSLNEDSIYNILKNYKTYAKTESILEAGPNSGLVRASLFIKNATVNIPARVSNILCTLTFKTPAGEFLPIKTFRLRNEDWSEYEQDIYGGEEFGPFTIEIEDLMSIGTKKYRDYRHEKYRTDLKKYTEILFACHLLYINIVK